MGFDNISYNNEWSVVRRSKSRKPQVTVLDFKIWSIICNASREKGIHIVPLAASGVDDTAEFLMRATSQLTMGRYLFLTDDSGIGNAHAEPKVDCNVVTRLDQLVERVRVDLMTGQRVEPEGDQVVRVVGDYKLGRCVIDESQPEPAKQ